MIEVYAIGITENLLKINNNNTDNDRYANIIFQYINQYIYIK